MKCRSLRRPSKESVMILISLNRSPNRSPNSTNIIIAPFLPTPPAFVGNKQITQHSTCFSHPEWTHNRTDSRLQSHQNCNAAIPRVNTMHFSWKWKTWVVEGVKEIS
ncbi:hypothetical protein AVEN_219206-1 [Araneus ventricosus]|uniref:Uncharacterized protein n=1 Tax=Araneus ventricosus TaxID=182803 RepID=A0A4Y2QGT5_ARAVE|nr:hypothetical protein AVEN_219206-1 [Araneus ventricosus]